MRKRKAHNLRVLVIDDDSELATVVVDSLRNAGLDAWAIRPTPSGAIDAIVTAAAAFKPDAILIDIVMPTDTASLVRGLKREPLLRRAKLFGCSGHAVLANSFAGLLDGFLHKPFTMTELAELLREEFQQAPVKKTAKRERPRARR
jgi:CheY-like chemotaxis protein